MGTHKSTIGKWAVPATNKKIKQMVSHFENSIREFDLESDELLRIEYSLTVMKKSEIFAFNKELSDDRKTP